MDRVNPASYFASAARTISRTLADVLLYNPVHISSGQVRTVRTNSQNFAYILYAQDKLNTAKYASYHTKELGHRGSITCYFNVQTLEKEAMEGGAIIARLTFWRVSSSRQLRVDYKKRPTHLCVPLHPNHRLSIGSSADAQSFG